MDDPRKTPTQRRKGEKVKKPVAKHGGNGRTWRRTPEAEDIVIQAITLGLTRRAAAAAADMSEDTLARWIREDTDFAERVKIADGRAEGMMTKAIIKATVTNWTAAAWWLERRQPADYGRKLESVVTVKRPEEMTDAELDALLESITAAGG